MAWDRHWVTTTLFELKNPCSDKKTSRNLMECARQQKSQRKPESQKIIFEAPHRPLRIHRNYLDRCLDNLYLVSHGHFGRPNSHADV